MAKAKDGDLEKIVESVEDATTFPVLTEEISFPGAPTPGAPAAPGAAPLGQVVQSAVRDVLGWRPKANDTKGFLAALNQSFTTTEVEGHTEVTWTPKTYAAQAQADLGFITGAQASIFNQAKVALDQALPLLDGLTPLRPDANLPDVESMRGIVRSELVDLVNEVGMEGGPRVQRVEDLFFQLGGNPWTLGGKGSVDFREVEGHLGQLRDRMGLKSQLVNTVDEEQNLTNFIILVGYTNSLFASWKAERKFFLPFTGEPFLGTQLVLLSRALEVVDEAVQEVFFAAQSVFLGPAQLQTIALEFDGQPSMFAADLLNWTQSFVRTEGLVLLRDQGKDGVVSFRETLEKIEDLVESARTRSFGGRQVPARVGRGYSSGRVQASLGKLGGQLEETLRLASEIRRGPAPVVMEISAARRGKRVRMELLGDFFQDGAAVFATPTDLATPKPADQGVPAAPIPADRTDVISSGMIFAVFSGQLEGAWSIVVRNPDGRSSKPLTLPNGATEVEA